jgi:hypothetical protein
MKNRQMHLKNVLAFSALAILFWLGTPARAQSVPAEGNAPVQDNEAMRQELASFDQFLDSHPEIAEQLRKNPSLADNEEFVKNHPALESYLREHPEIRERLRQNPSAFMRQEDRFGRRDIVTDRDKTYGQFVSFGEFLRGHANIAQQLSQDPSLVQSREYLENHPELKEYLNAHAEARGELMADPQGFIKSAQAFNHNNNGRDLATPMPEPKR